MFALFSIFPFPLALSFFLSSPVAAFTFTPGTPSECGSLPISWTGGTPPFQLLLTPVFGTPQNISIPSSAFNSGAGSFSTTLNMPQAAQLMLTMSDATGFNSGGTTSLLTVGAPKGGSSCNTTNPATAFTFQLNSALTQCRPFDFTEYSGAVQPVTIAAFIPGGTAFQLNPPTGSTSFSWNTNVIHGTSMIFSMTDAQGRQGGSSDVRTVSVSDDSNCLNSQSPSSTTATASSTLSYGSTPTSGSSTPTAVTSGHISIAAIAGTVIGALLFLAVVITLGLFFLRKKAPQTSGNIRTFSRPTESEIDLSYDPRQAPVVTPYSVPQNYDTSVAPHPYYPNPNQSPDANPFQDVPSQPVTQYQMPSQYQHPGAFQAPLQYYPPHAGYPPENPVPGSFYYSGRSSPRTEFEPTPQANPGQPTLRDSMSTTQRKAAMAGASGYKPSRFVLHTDADDGLPQPNDDGVVELPPQYSEHRRVLGVANPTAGHPSGKFPS